MQTCCCKPHAVGLSCPAYGFNKTCRLTAGLSCPAYGFNKTCRLTAAVTSQLHVPHGCTCDLQVARKQGWRPQTSAPSHQGTPAQPPAASPGKGSQSLHVAQYLPLLGSDQPASPTGSGAAATAVGQSNGADALHSAEAAAARASQIAEAAMTAGAAAEEVAADAEDYETASKYAQELLGSLGKPKGSATAGKRFYGERMSYHSVCDQTCWLAKTL